MAKAIKPILAEKFENLLWAQTPSDWIVKSVFINSNLCVVIILSQNNSHKIRRKFPIDMLKARKNDLWGLAKDCVQEMQSEINKLP